MSEWEIRSGILPGLSVVKRFLKSLASDLRFVGASARISRRGRAVSLSCANCKPKSTDQIKLGAKVRSRQLWEQRDFLNAFEHSSLRSLFLDGGDLSIDRITPEIVVCETRTDFIKHRYCRLRQAVPSGPRVGRRIAALVYDTGQQRRVLMGAIMLASPLYTVRARDEFLGWTGQKKIKDAGLRRVMDLSLCIALPPYNLLLAGKLMAILAVSTTMSREFYRRYGDHLLAVTTTAANGIHCPLFNRIMIKPGGLYRRIGETTGYTTAFFSDATLHAARALVKDRGLAKTSEIAGWNTIRVLKTALRHCHLNPEPLLQVGNRKGIYLSFLHPRSRELLQNGETVKRKPTISDLEAFQFWKEHILPRRAASESAIKKLKGWRFEGLEIHSPVAN
jgi:hypothetical protein